ncbi:hypothetical protein FB548_2918 [Pseudoxanthomonas sp. 3HH-4]|uniref:hypothetical protein n=1 Tax=Pseudoxanthomonas sp. 3HH-4 TaxID=1690214 RepID=UPI00114F98B1|nr:hypothetical protein [Pseudoxanthomonas sp. 3HH-4]TQM06546.1 hypothetical protein FB548_2918 [Pseudoxanthomonas sp. 3HH-4]
MKNLRSTLSLIGGAVLAAASLYDASLPTRALGLPLEGGEAVIAATLLSFAAVLFWSGFRGIRRPV